MRRRNCNLSVECVEQRLSLSTLGGTTPATAGSRTQVIEMEDIIVSSFHSTTQQPGGSQQIIAVLIG